MGNPNIDILACPVGQKISVFTGQHAGGKDAIFILGISCSVFECQGIENNPDYCSCTNDDYYQDWVSCVECPTSNCGADQYLSGCGGRSAGTCTACSNAANGYYYTSNGSSSNTCGTAACTSCSVGQTLSGCTRTSPGSCNQCPGISVGSYFTTAGSCATSLCSQNTFSTGSSSTSCASCPSNSYSYAGASVCTCNAGYYMDSTGACVQCTAGFFCNPTMQACSAGTYSVAGATACTPCGAGSYSGSSSAVACTSCGAGTYSASSSSVCTACGTGKYSTATGAQDENTCVPCNPGSYSAVFGATTCILCDPGTASNSFGTQGACGGCALNYFTPVTGSTACTPCSVPPCGIGFYTPHAHSPPTLCVYRAASLPGAHTSPATNALRQMARLRVLVVQDINCFRGHVNYVPRVRSKQTAILLPAFPGL